MNQPKHLVAHRNHTVDRLYRSKPFTSDEERLEHLFKLYEDLSNSESAFCIPKKKRPKGNGK